MQLHVERSGDVALGEGSGLGCVICRVKKFGCKVSVAASRRAQIQEAMSHQMAEGL